MGAFLTVGDKKFEVECQVPGIARGPKAEVDKAEGENVDERDYRCLSETALREFGEINELESWYTASQDTRDMRKAVSTTVYSMLDSKRNNGLDTRKRKGIEKKDDVPVKKKLAEKPNPPVNAGKTALERLFYQMDLICKNAKLPQARINTEEIEENGSRMYRCSVKADAQEFIGKKKKRASAERTALSFAVNTLKRKHKIDLVSAFKKVAPSILDLPPLVPPTHVEATESPPPVPHYRGVYQQPKGNTQQPSLNYHQSRGNYHQPGGNYPQPRGFAQQARENYPQPRGNTHQPRGNTQQQRGNTQQSMVNQPQSRGSELTGNARQDKKKPMTDEKKFRLDEKNRLRKAAEPRHKLFKEDGKVTTNPWLDEDL